MISAVRKRASMLWPTSSSDDFTVTPARSSIELTSAAALFRAYAKALPADLAPKGFSQELASLPGAYAPPAGELFLAKRGDHVLGCIAMKPLVPQTAEIGRLFVRPQARGIGVGKALVTAVLKAAAAFGYREIRLDMLPGMEGPAALYKSFGFAPVVPTGSRTRSGQVTLGLKLAAK